jgi:hypothetical protein
LDPLDLIATMYYA